MLTCPHCGCIIEHGEPADFDAFWKAYPRKQGKKYARKAWRQLSPDARGSVLDAIAAQRKKGCLEDVAYAPHPASWLNGERWEDEDSDLADKACVLCGAAYVEGGHKWSTTDARTNKKEYKCVDCRKVRPEAVG